MVFNKKVLIGLIAFSFIIAGGIQAAAVCDPCPPDCGPGLYCDRGGSCCEDGKVCTCNPTKFTEFDELIESIADFLFYIAMVVVPLMILIAAFYFITAAGDASRIGTGKAIIIWTLVGGAIIILAKAIIEIIRVLF